MLRLMFAASLSVGSLLAQGWVDRTPTNPLTCPSLRYDPAMCWDAAHGYVLLFGGVLNVGGADTWSWNGSAWTQRPTVTAPVINLNYGSMIPLARRYCAMTYHTPTSEVVLVCTGNTYTWTGSDWLTRASGLPTAIAPGSVPVNAALGRDDVRNQTVLFVGTHCFPNFGQPTVQQGSETLLWDGFSWSLRPTATHPFPAEQPSMVLDPATGRLLLCTTDATNSQSWFWEWNGSNWTQRSLAPTPAAGGALAADVLRGKVVMLDASLSPAPNHTWTVAGSVAEQLGLFGEPTRRQGAGIAFDPVRNRTVVFGGINAPVVAGAYALADTWEFELGAGASYATYGTGCAGARGVPSIAAQGPSLPHIGQTFSLQVNNLPLTGPVFLFLGVSNTIYGPTALPLSLGFLGAPGCTALASGDSLFVLTDVLGSAVWQFAVPNVPNAPGATFYNQAFVFDPTANALGLTTSNGGLATIGF